MEKCYRVEFNAHLQRVTLALKMKCLLQVMWKRGEKIAESGRVQLLNGEAMFDNKLSISCNMIYDTKTKLFREKITKFQILLHSEKGSKQAGEVQFNVAQYVNQNQLHKKNYEINLQKCPDKNAKISFIISGSLKQEISMDTISQQSYANKGQTPMLESKISLLGQKPKKTPPLPPEKQMIPTSDKNISKIPQQPSSIDEKIHNLQQENKQIRQQLKKMQNLRRENKQLYHRIQSEDYSSINEMKKKIENYRKEIQKIRADIRNNKDIEIQTKNLEGQILACKIKIMRAFNHAMEYGGSQLIDAIQEFCGLRQK